MERGLCIFGAGGFGRETLLWAVDSLTSDVIFCVSDEYYKGEGIMATEVIPLSQFDPELYEVVVAVGDPQLRKQIVESLPEGTVYSKVVHLSVINWSVIREGSIICPNVVLTCNIKIGRHAHLNLYTTIGHDCVIGDYFTTAPGVNISGNCFIGDCVYFGTNSAVKEGITICDNVTIGMGAVVVKDIQEPGVYVWQSGREDKITFAYIMGTPPTNLNKCITAYWRIHYIRC